MCKKTEMKALGINMNMEMANELKRRAVSMNIALSKYCKLILEQWITSGNKLKLTEK